MPRYSVRSTTTTTTMEFIELFTCMPQKKRCYVGRWARYIARYFIGHRRTNYLHKWTLVNKEYSRQSRSSVPSPQSSCPLQTSTACTHLLLLQRKAVWLTHVSLPVHSKPVVQYHSLDSQVGSVVTKVTGSIPGGAKVLGTDGICKYLPVSVSSHVEVCLCLLCSVCIN